MGYYRDPFIAALAAPSVAIIVSQSASERPGAAPAAGPPMGIPSDPRVAGPADSARLPSGVRRPPIINRGYFYRVAALDAVIGDFVAAARAQGLRSQVLSLGAGMDSTFWRLRAMGAGARAPDLYLEGT